MNFIQILTKFPETYKSIPEDIELLCKLDRTNINELLKYAIFSIGRINDSIHKCDNKAISTITIVISLSGAFYLLIKDNSNTHIAIKIIYMFNLIMVLISVLLSLWCLFVRYLKTPPPIGNTIHWLKKESHDTLNGRVIPTLIQSMATAERHCLNILEKKVNILKFSQAIGFISVTCIFISMMIIKIFFI